MGLAAADCAATSEPLATPTPAPELKFEIQTEQVGPSRTNVVLVATNIGLTDVLVETSLTLPENAGSDRDYSPTTRAKVTNEGGREVGGRAPEVKTLTWVPGTAARRRYAPLGVGPALPRPRTRAGVSQGHVCRSRKRPRGSLR